MSAPSFWDFSSSKLKVRTCVWTHGSLSYPRAVFKCGPRSRDDSLNVSPSLLQTCAGYSFNCATSANLSIVHCWRLGVFQRVICADYREECLARGCVASTCLMHKPSAAPPPSSCRVHLQRFLRFQQLKQPPLSPSLLYELTGMHSPSHFSLYLA